MRKVYFSLSLSISPELEIENLYDQVVENPPYEDK